MEAQEAREPYDVEHRLRLSPSPEGEGAMAVFEIYIKTTPERLWEAITDPQQRARYSFGVETRSDWTPGSTYKASVPGVVDINLDSGAIGSASEADARRRAAAANRAVDSVRAAR